MKAIVHTGYGIGGLELRDVEAPYLEDDQVLIRVHASSVNPADWYGVTGPMLGRVFSRAFLRPKDPRVGGDVAGRIEAVGKDVEDLQPGDEVFGLAAWAWAEVAVARATKVARKPANVSFEGAAAVPTAGLTALQALRDQGEVRAGQKVLINGASGGVGTFAVQIAKALGADVTAVCSTTKVDLVRSLGADRVCDYTRKDFTRLGERHDLMLDIAGSRPLRQFKRVLTRDGTIVLVGGPMNRRLGALPHIGATMASALLRRQKVKFFIAKANRPDLRFLAELLESGKVKPVIDRRYPLSEIAAALAYLGEKHARGKIVVDV